MPTIPRVEIPATGEVPEIIYPIGKTSEAFVRGGLITTEVGTGLAVVWSDAASANTQKILGVVLETSTGDGSSAIPVEAWHSGDRIRMQVDATVTRADVHTDYGIELSSSIPIVDTGDETTTYLSIVKPILDATGAFTNMALVQVFDKNLTLSTGDAKI